MRKLPFYIDDEYQWIQKYKVPIYMFNLFIPSNIEVISITFISIVLITGKQTMKFVVSHVYTVFHSIHSCAHSFFLISERS